MEIGTSGLVASRIGYGCMRIGGDGTDEGVSRGKLALRTAIDQGFTVFDHADVYGAGACERIFGEVIADSPSLRDQLTIISKCGARPGDPVRYELSRNHIVSSVESSLSRLQVDQIDILLLHRPDYLMDIYEVAAAFEDLHTSGKVREFGVSNFLPIKLQALQAALSVKLQVNQVEINIHNIDALENGTLDQCQALEITPQAWCPLGGIAWEAWYNKFTSEQAGRVNDEAIRQGRHYGIEPWQLALVWLIKHPAGIVPLIGSTTPQRIVAAPQALDVDYSSDDWYRLFEARNGHPVP